MGFMASLCAATPSLCNTKLDLALALQNLTTPCLCGTARYETPPGDALPSHRLTLLHRDHATKGWQPYNVTMLFVSKHAQF
jgi:hypothetical protein